MPSGEVTRFVRQTAAGVAADWSTVALYHGMTIEEYEALVAVFRREVEDGIRAGRVRLMDRLERKEWAR